MAKYKKIVIGVDQSYTRTGISISADGKLKASKSLDFKGLKTKTEKRNLIRREIESILSKNIGKAKEIIIIVERMRSFSSNNQSYSGNVKYIKATSSLISSIVDVAFDFGIKVYSVDTSAWKRQVVGTTEQMENSYGVNPKKWPTILFVEEQLGECVHYTNKLGNIKYDDDRADSICISLYGFVKGKFRKLKLEE